LLIASTHPLFRPSYRFSFDYGLVHYVSIDTEVAYLGGPEGFNTTIGAGPFGDQLTWLTNDLTKANANRAKVPWIVVGGKKRDKPHMHPHHHLAYPVGSAHSGGYPASELITPLH